MSDELRPKFVTALQPQDDLEARHWKASVARRLFGAQDLPPSIGRLRLLERVGQGAAGVVYSAYDPGLDRRVAVKLLKDEASEGELLVREARNLARLTHPNVVHVYDVGRHGEQVYLTMEYVDGGTLTQWLADPRSDQAVVEMFMQAGRGLAAAHAAELVHGDFKPANVLIGSDGRARVTDFGIARRMDPAASTSGGAGTVYGGTPAYMAPEQFDHGAETGDARSDQWSFCVALWEALGGARPFAGKNLVELIDKIRDDRPRPGPKEIPRRVARVLERGLAKDPRARYGSMQALVDELELPVVRPRGRVLAGVTLVLGLVLGLGVALARTNSPAVDPECLGLAHVSESLWTPSRRQSTEAAFRSAPISYGGETWERLDPLLAAYAERWRKVAHEACQDRPSEPLRVARRVCLRTAAHDFEGFVQIVGQARARTIERSVQGFLALQAPERCLGMTLADTRPPPPEGPELDALERGLAEASALRGVGLTTSALQQSRALVERARVLGYRPLEARALLLQGAVMADLIGTDRAAGQAAPLSLYAAELAAEPGSDLQVQVWQELVRAHARLGNADAVSEHAERARVAIEGRPDERHADGALLYWGSLVETDPERAAEGLTRAIERLDDGSDPPTPWLSKAINSMGELVFNRGLYEESAPYYRRAVAIAESSFGPSHPWVADSVGNLAETELLGEDFEAANGHFLRALEIRRGAHGPNTIWVAHTLAHIGDTHFRQGEITRAISTYQDAVEIVDRRRPEPGAPLSFVELDMGLGELEPWTQNALALAFLHLGRDDEALRHAKQGAEINPRPGERHPDFSARADALGLVLAAREEPAKAVTYLRGVVTQVDGIYPDDHRYRAWPHLALGVVLLEQGDVDEAREQLTRAGAVFRADPGTSTRTHALLDLAMALTLPTERARRSPLQIPVAADDEELVAWLIRNLYP